MHRGRKHMGSTNMLTTPTGAKLVLSFSGGRGGGPSSLTQPMRGTCSLANLAPLTRQVGDERNGINLISLAPSPDTPHPEAIHRQQRHSGLAALPGQSVVHLLGELPGGQSLEALGRVDGAEEQVGRARRLQLRIMRLHLEPSDWPADPTIRQHARLRPTA